VDYTIRTATKADITAVLALWRTAKSRPSVTDTEQALNVLLRRDSGALLLAADGAEIVGTLIVGWDGWRGSFYRLAVHPMRRRKGLAVALVGAGEEKLAGMGAVRLTAIVAHDERAAVALWESVGYERQADTSRFVRVLTS
jgi:ribosomal protein S18 acetylase RimI-like enzyme